MFCCSDKSVSSVRNPDGSVIVTKRCGCKLTMVSLHDDDDLDIVDIEPCLAAALNN